MKRSEESRLEDESRSTLKTRLVSKGWIARDIWERDVGLDMDVEIVEGGEVTGKRFWVQVKATESRKSTDEKVSCRMETKHLKYYEIQKLPVIIVYGIKKADGDFNFYYLFAQKYIRENISIENPNWKEQETVHVRFDSQLRNIEDLNNIATEGYFYIIQQQPISPTGAQYWLDGIPKSDDKELKELNLKALLYMWNEEYPAAIKEFDNILRVCVLSPTEMMSVLLNLGNAYYSLSKNDDALENYSAILELIKKVSEKDALEGEAAALGNIGLIYSDKGELDNALKYHQDALKIHREIGYKQGEANQLGNIGLIYSNKGELDNALKYLMDALKIHREIGYKQGEASALGNIGLIYSDKGKLDNALKYHQDALKIHREIGYKQGEANQLGNIGLIYSNKGELDNALKYLMDALKIHKEIGYKLGEANQLGNIGLIYSNKGELDNALKYLMDALKIHREIGYKQGEANQLSNIGLILKAKGELDNALKYLMDALKIHREIGYKQGEANLLGNIGLIYSNKGELDNALKYLKDALKIHREIGYKQGEANQLSNIGLILKAKGELDNALKYHQDALRILDEFNLIYGRNIILNAIKSIEKHRKNRSK